MKAKNKKMFTISLGIALCAGLLLVLMMLPLNLVVAALCIVAYALAIEMSCNSGVIKAWFERDGWT